MLIRRTIKVLLFFAVILLGLFSLNYFGYIKLPVDTLLVSDSEIVDSVPGSEVSQVAQTGEYEIPLGVGDVSEEIYRRFIEDFGKSDSADPEEFSAFSQVSWEDSGRKIVAQVTNISNARNTADLKVLNPRSRFPNDVLKEVTLGCLSEKTIRISSSNASLIKGNFDVKEAIFPNIYLFTYCKDLSCSEVGEVCILM
jgi:hypothetical protein